MFYFTISTRKSLQIIIGSRLGLTLDELHYIM